MHHKERNKVQNTGLAPTNGINLSTYLFFVRFHHKQNKLVPKTQAILMSYFPFSASEADVERNLKSLRSESNTDRKLLGHVRRQWDSSLQVAVRFAPRSGSVVLLARCLQLLQCTEIAHVGDTTAPGLTAALSKLLCRCNCNASCLTTFKIRASRFVQQGEAWRRVGAI